jgi:hypothetical protein
MTAGRAVRSRRLAVASVLFVVGLLAHAPGAFAAPNITLSKQAPDRVLYGETSPVTLRAATPSSSRTATT